MRLLFLPRPYHERFGEIAAIIQGGMGILVDELQWIERVGVWRRDLVGVEDDDAVPQLFPGRSRQRHVLAFEVNDDHVVRAGQRERDDAGHALADTRRGEDGRVDGLSQADELPWLLTLEREEKLPARLARRDA